jgi:hypothetical protein
MGRSFLCFGLHGLIVSSLALAGWSLFSARTLAQAEPPPSPAAPAVAAPAAPAVDEPTDGGGPAPAEPESGSSEGNAPESSAAPPSRPAPRADRQQRLSLELANIDARLATLERERADSSLALPVTLVSAGFGSALALTIVALDFSGKASEYSPPAHPNDPNPPPSKISASERDRDQRVAWTTGACAVVGFGIGLWGTFMLKRRRAQRRIEGAERGILEQRREQILRNLRYGAELGGGHYGLSVAGTF